MMKPSAGRLAAVLFFGLVVSIVAMITSVQPSRSEVVFPSVLAVGCMLSVGRNLKTEIPSLI